MVNRNEVGHHKGYIQILIDMKARKPYSDQQTAARLNHSFQNIYHFFAGLLVLPALEILDTVYGGG
jgi:hypothetical protein